MNLFCFHIIHGILYIIKIIYTIINNIDTNINLILLNDTIVLQLIYLSIMLYTKLKKTNKSWFF